MIPELAMVYGLSPSDVWNLTRSEWAAFLAHHEQLRRELSDGR